MAKLIVSEKFNMISQDWGKWVGNSIIFAGPALLVLAASIQGSLPKDSNLGIVSLYVLNILVDLLRKYLATSTYKPVDR